MGLLLDRDADGAAPLGPGAVVVPDLRISEQLLQDEPGVGGTLADPAIRDDLAVGPQALAGVDAPQVVSALEGPVLLDGGRPRHIDRRRDVAAALGALLAQALRSQQLARELARRADVYQADLADPRQHLVAIRAQ